MSDSVDDRPAADTAVSAVRPAREADLSRLLAIQGAALPDSDRTLLRGSVRASLALVAVEGPTENVWLSDGELSAERDVADTLPAGVDADTPVGYALFTIDEESVYVAELAVAPGHRRRGHGRRLLAAVAARNSDREQVRLATRVDNDAARSFYASLGFREARKLPDYYSQDGDTAEEPGDATDGVLLVRPIE
ncbi:MAG: GNAT family N-acetyltransferase [Haloglomus sp.]